MNSLEMKKAFLILYDKITSFSNPGYTNSEISFFLSKAQEQILLKYYNPESNRFQIGIENTEKLSKFFISLISKPTSLTLLSSSDYLSLKRFIFKLPPNHLFTLSEVAFAKSDDRCWNGKILRLDRKTNDEVTINLNNPFKKPDIEICWRLYQEPDEVVVYGSKTLTGINYEIVYLIRPNNINVDPANPVDSLFPEFVHQLIVDEAVLLATGTTNPEEYQIKQIQNNTNN